MPVTFRGWRRFCFVVVVFGLGMRRRTDVDPQVGKATFLFVAAVIKSAEVRVAVILVCPTVADMEPTFIFDGSSVQQIRLTLIIVAQDFQNVIVSLIAINPSVENARGVARYFVHRQ